MKMSQQTSQQTSPTDNPALDIRLKRIAERKASLAARMPKRQRVRVTPRDDSVRAAMKHPSGLGFAQSGSVEWPLDRFTRRRLADGAITRAPNQQKQEPSRPAAMQHE